MDVYWSHGSLSLSANEQTYVMTASSGDAALSWISNLQNKREEYIKMSAVMEETALEQERDKKTLKTLNRHVGALATPTDEEQGLNSPTNVRKIVRSKISRGSMALELDNSPTHDIPRRLTYDPLFRGDCQTRQKLSSTPDIEGAPAEEETGSPSGLLKPEHRKIVELEATCLSYQTELDKTQKQLLQLKDSLEHRDKTITSLNMEISNLKEKISKMNKPHHELRSEIVSLKDILEQYKRSMKTLDDEVEFHKLNQKEHEKKINIEKQKAVDMERDLTAFKSKYIKLLTTRFKIHIPNPSGAGVQEEGLEDVEFTKYTNELLSLVQQEGGDNPTFYKGSFEDQYGDIHDWQTGVVTQHYLCRQLYLHYNQTELESHMRDWEEFLTQVKRTRKPYLDLLSGGDRAKKKELRSLLRKGIPYQHRMQVWTSLVYQLVGRSKEIRDATAKDGSYYWSLVHSNAKSDLEKQIKIDLHRTLPNNRHFKLNGSGIPKLENVLLAYSLHNKNVGYCQGMNMVAALGLLFLDEETVFWFMVAIIEKLLPNYYYTPGLIGVQADQLVLKDLLAEKLPHLQAHLDNLSIDLTFITLNWFLTLFVDSMPTESALRIMDSFLLEGTKFLFRVSMGILRMHQQLIIKKKDPFILFQFLKELAKHIFDIENLYQEFAKFDSFPTKANLASRHNSHLAKVKENWGRRIKQHAEHEERKRNEVKHQLHKVNTSFIPKQPAQLRVVWECGCVCQNEEVWLCGGEGKLGIVSANGDVTLTITPWTSHRVICAHYIPLYNLLLVGTLDFKLSAIDCSSKIERWSHTMNDSILAIVASKGGKVFAALADGFVAVLQDLSESTAPESLLLKVGSTAVGSLLLAGPDQRYLWCGCGKSITVMCTETLEPVQSLVMGDGQGRVGKMVSSDVGIWVSFRSSSLLTLYDMQLYIPLLTIDYYKILSTQLELSEKEVLTSNYRVTSLMVMDGKLWVGSGGGCVYIFSYKQNVEDRKEAVSILLNRKRASERETTPTPAGNDGGLLTSVVLDQKEPENLALDEERSDRVDVNRKYTPSSDKEARFRRKTQFGKTLRNKSLKNRTKDQPDIYRLQLECNSPVITAPNEPVRVLLPLRVEEKWFVVSCVNVNKTDWQKGAQAWTCPLDQPPAQWSFEHLPPNIITPSPPPSTTSTEEGPAETS